MEVPDRQLHWRMLPAAGGDLVYVGDLSGSVHTVPTRDGHPSWTFKAKGEIKASPAIVGTLILLGSYDGFLYALDARTGAVRWKLETAGPVHATAAVAADMIYIAGCDSKFRAIRLRDGKQMFQVDAGSYTGSSPGHLWRSRVLRHLRQRGTRPRSARPARSLAVQRPGSAVSVLFVGGCGRRQGRPRRTR